MFTKKKNTQLPSERNSTIYVIYDFFLKWFLFYLSFFSLLAYTEQYIEYDPFLMPSDPSNPWLSDDTTFWEAEARYVVYDLDPSFF